MEFSFEKGGRGGAGAVDFDERLPRRAGTGFTGTARRANHSLPVAAFPLAQEDDGVVTGLADIMK